MRMQQLAQLTQQVAQLVVGGLVAQAERRAQEKSVAATRIDDVALRKVGVRNRDQ
jgi:ribosome biogenesis SPOUT family RNA methylase Rps3